MCQTTSGPVGVSDGVMTRRKKHWKSGRKMNAVGSKEPLSMRAKSTWCLPSIVPLWLLVMLLLLEIVGGGGATPPIRPKKVKEPWDVSGTMLELRIEARLDACWRM